MKKPHTDQTTFYWKVNTSLRKSNVGFKNYLNWINENITYQNLGITMKAIIRGKIIALRGYIKRCVYVWEMVSQINNAMMYLNSSSKNQVQNKSRSKRQEEIIKSLA